MFFRGLSRTGAICRLLRICPRGCFDLAANVGNRGADHRQIASNLVKLAAIFGKVNLARPLCRMAHLLLLNGPNLNLLGTREPGTVWVRHAGADRRSRVGQLAAESGHHLSAFQSNAEAELISRIHEAPASHVACIIFNPAAFTHTSVALRDALLGVKIPFIEVHLSNVYARSLSAITRTSPISPSARLRDWVPSGMSWRCARQPTT